jgi:hypothetical protein
MILLENVIVIFKQGQRYFASAWTCAPMFLKYETPTTVFPVGTE